MTRRNEPLDRASSFQAVAKTILSPHYEQVELEWMSSLGGSDALKPDLLRYAPRVDVAVGPFNISPGRSNYSAEQIWSKMRPWFDDLESNSNARCLLAIEVVFSGTAKHVLGDILNASALGHYGLIVCHEPMLPRVNRNLEYLQTLTSLGKLPELFRNVRVLRTAEFIAALQ